MRKLFEKLPRRLVYSYDNGNALSLGNYPIDYENDPTDGQTLVYNAAQEKFLWANVTDELVAVDAEDTAGYLIDKLTEGSNITITDNGSNLEISAQGGVESVDVLPDPAGYDNSTIVFLTTNQRLYLATTE